MIGVGEAKLFFAFSSFGDLRRKSSMSFWIAPVFTSTAIARNERPSSVAVVSQMRSPWITGDDQPRPGIAVFQRTFCVSLQVKGRLCSSDTPWPVGPRNCGQSWTEIKDRIKNRIITVRKSRLNDDHINNDSTRWAWTISSQGDHAKTVKRPSCEATRASASR